MKLRTFKMKGRDYELVKWNDGGGVAQGKAGLRQRGSFA